MGNGTPFIIYLHKISWTKKKEKYTQQHCIIYCLAYRIIHYRVDLLRFMRHVAFNIYEKITVIEKRKANITKKNRDI